MKNTYEIRGRKTAIMLKTTDGRILETLIDTDDLEKADSFSGTWSAHWEKKSNSYYAIGKKNKKDIRLHRFLTNVQKGMCVDHINHDSLDNRKENLRVVTTAQNLQNRKGAQSNNAIGVRGVTLIRSENRFVARIRINGKCVHCGSFKTVEEAETAVKQARRMYMKYSVS